MCHNCYVSINQYITVVSPWCWLYMILQDYPASCIALFSCFLVWFLLVTVTGICPKGKDFILRTWCSFANWFLIRYSSRTARAIPLFPLPSWFLPPVVLFIFFFHCGNDLDYSYYINYPNWHFCSVWKDRVVCKIDALRTPTVWQQVAG